MLDRKKLYKEALYKEYKNMYSAICRMTSYHEKLTTDGFELTAEDKEEINSVVEKVKKHAIKRLVNWSDKAEVK